MRTPAEEAVLQRYQEAHERAMGITVREFGEAKGLSHSQVAKRARVSERWLKKMESRELHTNYSLGRLDRVAHALDLNLGDLFKRAGELAGTPPWLEKRGQGEE